MAKKSNIIGIVFAIIALSISIVQCAILAPKEIDNVVNIATAGNGTALLLQVEQEEYAFDLIDENGVSQKRLDIPLSSGGENTIIRDFAINTDNEVYLIREYTDSITGDFLRQDLEVYDFDSLFPRLLATVALDDNADLRYKWVTATGSAVLMAENIASDKIVRVAYDTESLTTVANPKPRSTRIYDIDPDEGVYDVITMSDKIAIATQSGKVFVGTEDMEAVQIYPPQRQLDMLMYPMFIAQGEGSDIYMGEQESGDIVSLDIETGATTVLLESIKRFTGIDNYSPENVLMMSMIDTLNFASVVRNIETDYYSVLLVDNDVRATIDEITDNVVTLTGDVLVKFIVYFLAMLLVYWAIDIVIKQVRSSKTILLKLIFASIPLLIVSFGLFGIFSYSSYSDSIEINFEMRVADEGNLLRALLGEESFHNIKFPYDHTSDDYMYIQSQFEKRDVFARTAFYEDRELYIGVDEDLPCYYPFDLIGNSELRELYTLAAYDGEPQTAVIEDYMGKRITCVTPIGGADGSSVYLIEVSVDYENLSQYTDTFLWQYIIVAVIFITIISLLLIFVFGNVLNPLTQMKAVMEEFAKGNRRVRLATETDDELSDVSRVFNKLANDIDVQIYELKGVSETYYRFVPQRIFQLLGKEQLADINLGDKISGEYNVLTIDLSLAYKTLSTETLQKITDHFFNIMENVCNQYDATMLSDRIDLQNMKIICREGGETGVNIALAALAQIDGYNATVGLQQRMSVQMLLHRTEILYAISGNEEWYVPTILSDDLNTLTAEMDSIREYSARLIVTESAYATIQTDRYYHRGIGHLVSDIDKDMLLYDFYDSSTPEIIQLINNSRLTFDKAMELYEQERYYDAKNLFALVLRENQYDNVARNYIFRCESQVNNTQTV